MRWKDLRSNLQRYANNDGSIVDEIQHLQTPFETLGCVWSSFKMWSSAWIHPVRLDISGSWKPDGKV